MNSFNKRMLPGDYAYDQYSDPSKRQMMMPGTTMGNLSNSGPPPPTEVYPRRPGEDPCAFFVRTGTCKFGDSCKFDHPPNSYNPSLSTAPTATSTDIHPKRPGAEKCAFYMKTGECKFGTDCKYDHPDMAPGAGPVPASLLSQAPNLSSGGSSSGIGNSSIGNSMPSYGSSMSGMAGAGGPNSALAGLAAQLASIQAPALNSPGVTGGLPNLASFQNGVGNPVLAAAQLASLQALGLGRSNPMLGAAGLPGLQGTIISALLQQMLRQPQQPHPPTQQMVHNLGAQSPLGQFPQRPGEPECSFFIKTGDCKFGPTCKFDHPIHKAGNELESGKKERLPCQFFMKTGTCSYGTTCRFRHTTKEQLAREGISVEDAGPLPRNPDEKECTFFLRTGKCAYGFTCRFDHPPRDESNTKASSVKDES